MSEHVIAMDPGGRSGWASARMSTDSFVLTGGGVLRQDMMADWYWSHGPEYDVMVYESWFPREENGSMEWIKGNRLLTPQHIGQLRWIAKKFGARIVEQHPTDKPQALASMPNDLLDLDKYSNEQHDKDARMHLWLYYWRQWFSATVDPATTVTL